MSRTRSTKSSRAEGPGGSRRLDSGGNGRRARATKAATARRHRSARRLATRDVGRSAVDAYLAAQSPPMRGALRRIRILVRAAAPEATEVISYRIPAFRTERGVLVWYAGFATHGSFFPGALRRFPALNRAMKRFATAKGTLRFTLERPLPADLITRLVRARLREQSNA